jgi:hypothetical protein
MVFLHSNFPLSSYLSNSRIYTNIFEDFFDAVTIRLVSKKQIMLYIIILNNRLLPTELSYSESFNESIPSLLRLQFIKKLLTEHICITLDPNLNTCHCVLELECLFENFLPFDINKSSIQVWKHRGQHGSFLFLSCYAFSYYYFP